MIDHPPDKYVVVRQVLPEEEALSRHVVDSVRVGARDEEAETRTKRLCRDIVEDRISLRIRISVVTLVPVPIKAVHTEGAVGEDDDVRGLVASNPVSSSEDELRPIRRRSELPFMPVSGLCRHPASAAPLLASSIARHTFHRRL